MIGPRVQIGETVYVVRDVNYEAESDVYCTSLPINQFSCAVKTNGATLTTGVKATLMDSESRTYASYRITSVENIGDGYVRVIAKSPLAILDDSELPLTVIVDGGGKYIIDYLQMEVLTPIAGDYVISPLVGGMINGGCYPKQTRRERLLWVLFVMGFYCAFNFDGKLYINVMDDNITLVPLKNTFWRPSITQKDLVTKIEAYTYKYTEEIPENFYDDYIAYDEFSDGESEGEFVSERVVQKQTKSYVCFENSDAPANAIPNVISLDETCVYPGRAGAVMNRLANRYFTRDEITCDTINNHAYYPGMRVAVYLTKSKIYVGYVEACNYQFGSKNVKSRMKITQCQEVQMGGEYTVIYTDTESGDELYREEGNYFPLGWTYAYTPKPIVEKYLSNTVKVVARPTISTINGTIQQADTTLTVPCNIELSYFSTFEYLSVWGVDDITEEPESDLEGDSRIILEIQGGGTAGGTQSNWEVTYGI